MDGFLTCVHRMVPDPQKHVDISKEMKIYRIVGGTFGFNMDVNDRKTKMPGKLQVHFIANFKSLLHLFQSSNFKISMLFFFNYVSNFLLSLICSRCFVDKLWPKSTTFTKACHSGANANM